MQLPRVAARAVTADPKHGAGLLAVVAGRGGAGVDEGASTASAREPKVLGVRRREAAAAEHCGKDALAGRRKVQ